MYSKKDVSGQYAGCSGQDPSLIKTSYTAEQIRHHYLSKRLRWIGHLNIMVPNAILMVAMRSWNSEEKKTTETTVKKGMREAGWT